MTPADLSAAERLSSEAFLVAELRTARRGEPDPVPRSEERRPLWISRTGRVLEHDPGGCWVAEDDGEMVGFATSMVRERLWVLATFAVRPAAQGRGIGRRLLERSEAYGAGCDRAILSASEDPPALRRYHAAGFALFPQLLFSGTPNLTALPAVSGLRDGTPADRGWMDDLDRDLRGGPHGPDHRSLGEMARLLVCSERTGYAYASPTASFVVAAREAARAAELLWACLARSEGAFEVPHVTTANPWAIEVAMAARLSMSTHGYLAVRGMTPPSPYVHNGALL